MTKQLRRLSIVILLMFVSLFAATSWIQVAIAPQLAENPENRRSLYDSYEVQRGTIFAGGTAIASSVPTYARKIDGSLYIWALGCVKPVAGPPERIVTSTPVYSPEAMRGPVTDFSSLSTV